MNTEKDRKELREEGNQGESEDDKTTESVIIITPHVTNPSPELLLIWRIRSLHDHDHILIQERERRERIITSLVTIANSETGGLICDHLLKHGATTISILEEVIPTTKATASRTLRRLINFNVVETRGHVGPPYRPHRKSGPRVPIYTLKGAAPQASHDAQRRHAELKLIKTSTTPDPIRQGQLPEAIALCKTWMNDRGLRTIPDSQILTPMLEVQGIKVSYDKLITALRKEGYSL